MCHGKVAELSDLSDSLKESNGYVSGEQDKLNSRPFFPNTVLNKLLGFFPEAPTPQKNVQEQKCISALIQEIMILSLLQLVFLLIK